MKIKRRFLAFVLALSNLFLGLGLLINIGHNATNPVWYVMAGFGVPEWFWGVAFCIVGLLGIYGMVKVEFIKYAFVWAGCILGLWTIATAITSFVVSFQ